MVPDSSLKTFYKHSTILWVPGDSGFWPSAWPADSPHTMPEGNGAGSWDSVPVSRPPETYPTVCGWTWIALRWCGQNRHCCDDEETGAWDWRHGLASDCWASRVTWKLASIKGGWLTKPGRGAAGQMRLNRCSLCPREDMVSLGEAWILLTFLSLDPGSSLERWWY